MNKIKLGSIGLCAIINEWIKPLIRMIHTIILII